MVVGLGGFFHKIVLVSFVITSLSTRSVATHNLVLSGPNSSFEINSFDHGPVGSSRVLVRVLCSNVYRDSVRTTLTRRNSTGGFPVVPNRRVIKHIIGVNGSISGFTINSCTNINYFISSYNGYGRYLGKRSRFYLAQGILPGLLGSKGGVHNKCSGLLAVPTHGTVVVPGSTSLGHAPPLLYTNVAI